MLPLAHYQRARHEARFHVQVKFDPAEVSPPGPAFVPLNTTIVRVFRGGDALKPGDRIAFKLPITWPGDDLPCGGVIWKPHTAIKHSGYAEAFLNGNPPDCQLALWQIEMLEAPSDVPRMQGYFPIAHARHTFFERIAKWWGRA
ncbi:MAG TPA: hypothetical protein PLJ47_07765 [Candidatus Hydrogenedentes bacterium]|nr:hypothetical protein [Candidatus Hydrogenedentota bacterium]